MVPLISTEKGQMEVMKIRSSFGDLTRWPELKPGIPFYVPDADGVRLAMKVEHHEHGTLGPWMLRKGRTPDR